jgi:hypothetical protein
MVNERGNFMEQITGVGIRADLFQKDGRSGCLVLVGMVGKRKEALARD